MTRQETMEPGRELDALVCEKVMGLEVVGVCDAWDSSVGYAIHRPTADLISTLQPVYLRHCNCDFLPLVLRNKDDTEEGRARSKRRDDRRRAEFEADRAVWGHSSGCLSVVHRYSTHTAADVKERLRTHYQEYVTVGDTSAFPPAAVPIELRPFTCVIGSQEDPIAEAQGVTEEHAICLAALEVAELTP